jgi:transposase
MCSALNNGKAAIPLLKWIQERLPLNIGYATLDYEAIYKQIHQMKAKAIFAYNKRNEGESLGFAKNFAPTLCTGQSYRYASFDEKYQTPTQECKTCPLTNDSLPKGL